MNAIFAFDSFKGCLTSLQAAEAAARGLGKDDDFVILQVSDGGEGFTHSLSGMLGGEIRHALVHDPLGRPVEASFALVRSGRTAILETAAASGLTLVENGLRDPSRATSYGTGELIAAALDEGVDEVIIGLGGSAVNDAGAGMLQALGYRLETPEGFVPVMAGAPLFNVTGIDASLADPRLRHIRIRGFYDVDVPLCGPGGATRMFSAQKGASDAMAGMLENWMERTGSVYSMISGRHMPDIKGAGAAGGIGAAVSTILHGEMESGIEGVLAMSCLRISLDMGFDTVFTGEGRADRQTLCGKAPKGVLDAVRMRNPSARVYLLAGDVRDRELLEEAGFDGVFCINPAGNASGFSTPSVAERRLEETVRTIATI